MTRPCPGKEIILRKYLADQWDSAQEGAGFGFVSQALGHLQQEYGEPGAGAGLGGGLCRTEDRGTAVMYVCY